MRRQQLFAALLEQPVLENDVTKRGRSQQRGPRGQDRRQPRTTSHAGRRAHLEFSETPRGRLLLDVVAEPSKGGGRDVGLRADVVDGRYAGGQSFVDDIPEPLRLVRPLAQDIARMPVV